MFFFLFPYDVINKDMNFFAAIIQGLKLFRDKILLLHPLELAWAKGGLHRILWFCLH